MHGTYGRNRNFGIDVVGYLLSEIGLGEAARLMIAALDAAQIPTGLINVPLEGRMSETALVERIGSSQRHSTALSILPVPGLANFARRTCRGQKNIAYPYWELPTFPKSWKRNFDGFDAYWAPTTFIRDALLEYQDKPVHLVPQPIFLPDTPPSPQDFTTPLKFYTFFDFDSFMARKNPMGAIHAFRAAFPRGTEDVRLLIKARGTPSARDRRELYAHTAADPRIEVVERLLRREEMNSLMDSSNVFISLHRSEGFGLGCAEALARGKIVVATDFGGTRDYITDQTGYPVSFKPVALQPDEYPGGEGSYWAEPEIEQAVSVLQKVYADPSSTNEKTKSGFRHLMNNNSLKIVGEAIRKLILGPPERVIDL